MIPRTHLFAFAIGNYQDPGIAPVQYAGSDVVALVQAWQDLGVEADDCVLLTDSQATLTATRSRLRKFAGRIAAGDRVVLVFSGHGFSLDGASRLAVHDTVADDLAETSLAVDDLLNQLHLAKCDETLLFLDACHGAMSTGNDVDLGPDPFDGHELDDFCRSKKGRWAFFPSSPNERSHRDHSSKTGIWTDCLVSALNGRGKNAVTKNGTVTIASLQAFLADELPRRVRAAVAGTATQTPRMLGDSKSSLPIADLNDLFHQRQLSEKNSGSFISESSLSGEIRGPVRGLSGYRKPSQPLSSHNQWEQSFVEGSGEADVAKLADEIFTRIRESFRYKRKDASLSKDGPVASIRTPDFDVNIGLMQDPAEADQYLMRTDVVSIRRPEVVDDPNFLSIFTKYCDRVVFAIAGGLDIAARIDEIEEAESLEDFVEYDPDCTEFTLRLPGTGIIIRGTPDRIVFSLDRAGDLKTLLGKTRRALSQLADSGITLGLPRRY